MREKITSAIFIIILAAFFALVMIFPKDEQASVQENRPLAEMPAVSAESILSGNFGPAYENYLTDNVGFRSYFVNFGSFIENLRGIQPKNMGRIVEVGSGKLVLNDGKIMEVFSKNPEVREAYISVLNDYADKLGKKSDMYIMLVPTQIEFDESEYRTLSDSQKETIDYIYSALRGFKTVNVYDKLKANTDGYIYFRTDHHWTQRGAYFGYESLMEAAGQKAVPLDDMTNLKLSGFLGYLYNQANVPDYAKYADDIEYFESGENYTVAAKAFENGELVEYSAMLYCPPTDGSAPKYSLFIGGDHAFAEIDTNNKNGKTALVIKDSYANAVLPLMTNNYEKIIVIDPRSYFADLTTLSEEYEIDDVFVINYVFTSTFSDYTDNLERIK